MTTTLMIQQDRIRQNLHQFQKAVGNTGVIPNLSGNAQGAGDVQMARLLHAEGVRLVAVSRIEEAVRVKNAVAGLDVLLLTPYSTEAAAETIVKQDIIATVGSYDSGVVLNGIAGQIGKKVRYHLQIDTGGGRFGFLPDDLQKAVQTVKYLPNLVMHGIYTSITAEDCKKQKEAIKRFDALRAFLSGLKRAGITSTLVHGADAAVALQFQNLRLDAVRCGSALLGGLPVKNRWGFQKVGRLVTEICEIRWVPKGYRVGMGRTYRTRKPAKIALVPASYADGLGLQFAVDALTPKGFFGAFASGFGQAFSRGKVTCDIKGKNARVLGYLDCDTVAVDVTKIECAAGDMVSFDVRPAQIDSAVSRSYV